MRAVVYLRISQDREGKRLGVDRQRGYCQELAERLNATITAEFCDNDRGASTLSRKKRPEFEEMMRRATAGEVDAIISYSTSRLTRRPMEIENLIPLGERYGVKILTVKHGDYDLNSARGRRRAREDAAKDAEEVEELAERVRDEVKQRAQQGRFHGGPDLFGFDGAQIRPEQAAEIHRWADRVLSGESLRSIATDVQRRGVADFSAWTVRRILINPRVAGLRVLNGEEYPAPNPEILEPETWRAMVRMLTTPARRRGTSTARKYLGVGLYLCDRCDRTVGSNYARRGYLIYRCTGCWRSWRLAPVDEFITDLVAERLAQPDAADLVAAADQEQGVEELHMQAAAKRQRLTQLAEDFADDELTADQLRAATDRLRRQIGEIEDAIAAASRNRPLMSLVYSAAPATAWRAIEDLSRQQAVIRSLAEIRLGTPPRGRQKWTPWVLAGSRWVNDTVTWGEQWRERGLPSDARHAR